MSPDTQPPPSARDIMRRYGKNYYLATAFFPRTQKQQTYDIYKLVRLPDLIVDQPGVDDTTAKAKLITMRQQRQDTYADPSLTNDFTSIAQLFRDQQIDATYVSDFFDAMIMDTEIKRYETYEQLRQYMRGSASVVGLMMCGMVGAPVSSHDAATKLGEAMQLTNFLRDIREDYEDLGRVYLPLDYLKKKRLTHADVIAAIQTREVSNDLRSVIRDLCDHAQKLYRQADTGIPLLPRYARLPVRIASRLYQGILHRIRRHDYDSITHDCHTSQLRKIIITIKTIFKF